MPSISPILALHTTHKPRMNYSKYSDRVNHTLMTFPLGNARIYIFFIANRFGKIAQNTENMRIAMNYVSIQAEQPMLHYYW